MNNDLNSAVIGFQRKINTNLETLTNTTAARDSSVSSLVTTQTLTGSYANAGVEINVIDYNRLGLYVACDTNDSRSITLQVLGSHTSGGTQYIIDGISIKTIIDAVTTTDKNIYYEFDVGTIPYVQIQIKAGTVGASPGTITIHIDKKWRN